MRRGSSSPGLPLVGEKARQDVQFTLQVCALNEERAELEARLDAMKDVSISQEGELKVARAKLKQLDDDLVTCRCELDDVRSVKNQLDAQLSAAQRQLSRKASELHASEDRVAALEVHLAFLLKPKLELHLPVP